MELAKKLLSNLFPSRCLLCQKTIITPAEKSNHVNIEICQKCLASLPFNQICCDRCAVPLEVEDRGSIYCGRCIKKQPAFDYVYSPLRYEDEVIRLVHQLKFNEKIIYSRTLGEVMFECWVSNAVQNKKINIVDKPDCMLPVPLHKSRMRQRGFNQSIELSRVISKKLELPVELKAVTRVRRTESQTGLNMANRRTNIRGAFKIEKSLSAKHVLIIDDVMTTGSTVEELALVLKQNGAKRVGVLCLARAPMKG